MTLFLTLFSRGAFDLFVILGYLGLGDFMFVWLNLTVLLLIFLRESRNWYQVLMLSTRRGFFL